jgi:hypothetical protein
MRTAFMSNSLAVRAAGGLVFGLIGLFGKLMAAVSGASLGWLEIAL